MGWFSWFRKKVVKPVVETVVEVVNTVIVEPIIEHVVEPVVTVVTEIAEAVVPPIIDVVQSGFAVAKDYVITQATKLAFAVANGVTDVAFKTMIDIWDTAVDKIGPKLDADYTEFEVVGQAVAHVTYDTADISVETEVELRDAIVTAQVGHADYDVFLDAGAIDADGYVTDEVLFYETGEWYAPLENWAEQRFDVIRVVEANSDFFIPTYESNVVLMQNVVDDTYYIAVGGTVGLADIITDINLVIEGTTGDSVAAISGIIDMLFEEDIPENASVVLSGMSLGGAEVVLQYRNNPEAFDHVYAISSAGLGGIKGTYYDENVWDGMGDEKITEINGDDPGYDFNDLVTSLGHVGAGQTYFIDEIIQAPGDIQLTAQLEVGDTHNLGNIFASLPNGATSDVPLGDTAEDAFMFV